MPGEWNTHSRCWMLWIKGNLWNQGKLDRTRKEFARVAKVINKFEVGM